MLPAPWLLSKSTRNRRLRIRSASTVSSTASRWAVTVSSHRSTIAKAILRQPGGRARAIAFQDFAARSGGNHAAFGREQFQPVVRRGIVAGGDLNRAGGGVMPQQNAGGGRGDDAGVDRRASHGLQPGLDGQREHSARGPAIASDQDVARRQRRRKRRRVANRHLRRQRLANDSAKSRNADDRFGHD